MTRDELEAVIREQLTHAGIAGMWEARKDAGPEHLTRTMNRATEAILKAADAYGLAEFGLEAERRRALLAGTVGDGSYGGRAS